MTLASAYLLTLSQRPNEFGWIAAFALVPWFIATRAARPLEAVGLGVMAGVFFGAVGSSWIFSAFEAQGAVGGYSIVATLLTVFWGKGLIFGAAAGATRAIRNAGPVVRVLVVSTLFGLGELWMSESQWGLPVVLLGHSQISVPGVSQLAILGGVPVISGLLIALNLSLALAIEGNEAANRLAASLVVAWLTVALLGVPLATNLRPPPSQAPRTVLLVQPEIPREQRWEPAFQNVILDRIAAQTTKALNKADHVPDVILWPENLLTTPLDGNPRLERQLLDYVDEWGVPVVTGLVRRPESSRVRQYRSSVAWFSPQEGMIDVVDKVRAMPLVESNRDFVGRELLSGLIGGSFRGPQVAEATIARPLVGEFTLSPALCFEVLFPAIVADRRDENSLAIVNLADDSWVPGEVADSQLIAAAAFRAIEQRMTLLRVSHGGVSLAIDPFGRKIASLPPNVFADMTIEVVVQPPITPLEKISFLALFVGAGIFTWGFEPRFASALNRLR